MLSTERLKRSSTEKCKGQTTQAKAHNAVRSFSKLSCYIQTLAFTLVQNPKSCFAPSELNIVSISLLSAFKESCVIRELLVLHRLVFKNWWISGKLQRNAQVIIQLKKYFPSNIFIMKKFVITEIQRKSVCNGIICCTNSQQSFVLQ